jgi:hypothetical protein
MNKVKKFVDGNLAERLKHVDNLSQEVYKALLLPMNKHNIWAVNKMNKLTLLTDDSILATRLRLEQHAIIRHFKQKLNISIGTITVKMAMPSPQPPKKEKANSKIASHSAKTMISIANDIEDKELREQLIRMAKQNNNA